MGFHRRRHWLLTLVAVVVMVVAAVVVVVAVVVHVHVVGGAADPAETQCEPPAARPDGSPEAHRHGQPRPGPSVSPPGASSRQCWCLRGTSRSTRRRSQQLQRLQRRLGPGLLWGRASPPGPGRGDRRRKAKAGAVGLKGSV